MAYPKGKPRPEGAGRQKGTPNKSTEYLQDLCDKNGINVFEAMLKVAKDAYDPALRFNALKELAQYLYPKRKALEITGDAEGFKIVIEDYTSKK